MNGKHIAHFNVARLIALPGDPAVSEFIDNVPRVNAVAERSPGFVWRLSDQTKQVDADVFYQSIDADPYLAISFSVWESPDHFRAFVHKTIHGAFLRRRATWFERTAGPNYVMWTVEPGIIPALDDGWARIRHLAANGPSAVAFDLASLDSGGW